MDLDGSLKGGRPVSAAGAAGSATVTKLDPVILELGAAGEDGERLVFFKYQDRVRRFFRKKGVPEEDAPDLTQDTFLRVFRAEASFDTRAQLEAWLFEIAWGVWANWVRERKALKRAVSPISLDEPDREGKPRDARDAAYEPGGGQDAETAAITREQLALLRRELAELPEQMRQCVRLRLRDDLKYKEIAEVRRISIETVKSHIHQAKQRLRSKLEPVFGRIDFEE
jgi:RNA polymerase sigma-70 factor (ECF subfamily)